MNPQQATAEVRGWIDAARRVAVLTGAGISTDSGIPDFRGPQGVWTRNPAAERLSTIDNYLAEPQVRRDAWQARLGHSAWRAQPNPAHAALVALERRGKLHALITQNIDELHQIAGNSPELVIEVHGTMRRAMCWQCGERTPMLDALARVQSGEADPACRSCGGILKSDTIYFGQALDQGLLARAMKVAREADVMIAVGTTLQVYPIAEAVPIAQRAGARIIIVNGEATALDDLADALLRGSISELLPGIC